MIAEGGHMFHYFVTHTENAPLLRRRGFVLEVLSRCALSDPVGMELSRQKYVFRPYWALGSMPQFSFEFMTSVKITV